MPEFKAREGDAKSSVASGPDLERLSKDVQEPHTTASGVDNGISSDANRSIEVNRDAIGKNDASGSPMAAAATDSAAVGDDGSQKTAADHDLRMIDLEETSENTRDSIMSSEDKEKEKAVAEAVALTAAAVAAITGAMKDEEKKKSKITVSTNKSKNGSKKSDKISLKDSISTKHNLSSARGNSNPQTETTVILIGQIAKANNTSNDLVDPEIQRKDSDVPAKTSGDGETAKQMAKEDIIDFYQQESAEIAMPPSTVSSKKVSANNSVPKKHTMKPPPQLKDLETSDNLKNWRDFMRFDDAKTKMINEPSKGKYIYVCALCNKEFFYNSRNGPRTIVSHLKKHKDHYLSGKNNNTIMENMENLNNGPFANSSFINSIQTNGSTLDILNNPEAAAMEVISKLTNQDIDTSKISITNENNTSNNNNGSHFDQLDESKLDNIVKNASKKWRSHFIEILEDQHEGTNDDKKNDRDKNSDKSDLKEQQKEAKPESDNLKDGERSRNKEGQEKAGESEKEVEKKRKGNTSNISPNMRKLVTKYKCKYCDRQFTYCSRNGPTSLIRHLENLHKPQFLNPASLDIISNNDNSDTKSSGSFSSNTIGKKSDVTSADTDKDDINCMLYIAKAARFWRLHYDKNEEKTDALIFEKEKETVEGKTNDESITSPSQFLDKKPKESVGPKDSGLIDDSQDMITQNNNDGDKSMVITKGPLKRKSRYSPEVYDCKFCGSSKVYLSRNGPKTLSRHLEKHHKKELLQIDEHLLSTVSYEIFKRSNENFV